MVSRLLASDGEGGYASPAALVLSLALAAVGSALVMRSVQTLALARADLARAQAEYTLDGAQLAAAAAVVRSRTPGPYAWSFTSEAGWIEALAEPETDKLSPAAAAGLNDEALLAFGVASPSALRAKLASAAAFPGSVDIAALDPAPQWRNCGPALVSPLGTQESFAFTARQTPGPGDQAQSWHVGEAWRIRVATPAGWRDDRIVRFTGDARHPAAVVVRTLTRTSGRGGECEEILKKVAAG